MILIKLSGEVEKPTNNEFFSVSVSVCDDDGKNAFKVCEFKSALFTETEKTLHAFIERYVRVGTKVKVITEIDYIS